LFLVASFGSLTTNGSVFTVDVTSDDDETSELCSKLLVTVLDLHFFVVYSYSLAYVVKPIHELFDAFLLPFHLLAHDMF
jgi:hypothetical protein